MDLKIILFNWFQPLQQLIDDSEASIETLREHGVTLWLDMCVEVLGKKKTEHKEWISSDTIKTMEKRKEKIATLNTRQTRADKAKTQEEYRAVNREVKKSTKKDKEDYVEELASPAENAAGQMGLKCT